MLWFRSMSLVRLWALSLGPTSSLWIFRISRMSATNWHGIWLIAWRSGKMTRLLTEPSWVKEPRHERLLAKWNWPLCSHLFKEVGETFWICRIECKESLLDLFRGRLYQSLRSCPAKIANTHASFKNTRSLALGCTFLELERLDFVTATKKMEIFIYMVSGLLEKAGQSCTMQRYIFDLIWDKWSGQ